jgi:hypothetical protein
VQPLKQLRLLGDRLERIFACLLSSLAKGGLPLEERPNLAIHLSQVRERVSRLRSQQDLECLEEALVVLQHSRLQPEPVEVEFTPLARRPKPDHGVGDRIEVSHGRTRG